MPYASGAATSAVLADGLHYLGGSSNYSGNTRYVSHHVFRSDTGAWNKLADVTDRDTWGARAHAYGGKLYLVGGYPGGNKLRVYDRGSNRWTTLQAPPGGCPDRVWYENHPPGALSP